MTKTQQSVLKIPIEKLFDEEQSIELQRLRDLGAVDIKEFLRLGPVRFVVANVGKPLGWISESDSFNFWKIHVVANLLDPKKGSTGFRLDDYPNQFVYAASEWIGASYIVVLLEMHH